MGVFWDKGRKKASWRYEFRYRGERHRSTRGFTRKKDAEDAERALRIRLERAAAGLGTPSGASPSPRIVEWAGVYLRFVETIKKLRDAEGVAYELRVVLRFWGARPLDPADDREPDAPYHDLRLRDPIDEPDWILQFEAWLHARGISARRRNILRTRMSQLYALAMSARYRKETGMTLNPFRGTGLRERTYGRTVTWTLAELQRILQHAPEPLRRAIGIAALAPKLRLSNVCALCWTRDASVAAHAALAERRKKRRPNARIIEPSYVSADRRQLIVEDHKTMERTGPMIAPVSAQLHVILDDAYQHRSQSPYVIGATYDRFRIKEELRTACEAAGVPYGRKIGAATFHSIRHTMATLLAAQGVPEGIRKQVMGHLAIQTTQRYTHLQPTHEIAPLEQMSAAMPIADLVAPRREPPRKKSSALLPFRRRNRAR